MKRVPPMKYEFDSVAIAAVYMGEDLFPADRSDLSADYIILQRHIVGGGARLGVADMDASAGTNYQPGTLTSEIASYFNGIYDFSIAVSIYLDDIAALDVPDENRKDHICALARQYIAPAAIAIANDHSGLAAHECQPDIAAG